MKPIFKKIITYVTMVIPTIIIGGGGIAKLVGPEPVVKMLTKVGVGPYIPFLGIAEVLFIVLFLVPKTKRIGYILLCCYFGGAIATVFSHDGSLLNPAVLPLVLITINIYLRDKSFFAAAN